MESVFFIVMWVIAAIIFIPIIYITVASVLPIWRDIFSTLTEKIKGE